MSTEAIKIGEAFVEIGANATELNSVVDGATDKIKSFGEQACNVVNAIAIGWGAMQAAAVGVTTHFAAVGDHLDKMSQRTGISAKTLSELSYVAGQCGASVDGLECLMFPLSEKVLAGDENFAKLGLSFEHLQRLSPEMQFMSVAQAISDLESSTEQAAMATAMFGGDGEKLLPMLKQGADGILNLSTTANELAQRKRLPT